MDVLVIDDVHFLANKKATQEEFLHTFNAIDAGSKQIVMASDAHPKLIGQFSESLVSRFMAGMVVCIEPPTFPTRCEILQHRAIKLSRIVPQEVIEYIAQNVTGSVRELEGALLKLIAFNSVAQLPMTVSTAQKALADYLSRTRPLVTISDLESAVATFFGLSPADLHSTRKTQHVALARNIAMHLARKHTTLSLPADRPLHGQQKSRHSDPRLPSDRQDHRRGRPGPLAHPHLPKEHETQRGPRPLEAQIKA